MELSSLSTSSLQIAQAVGVVMRATWMSKSVEMSLVWAVRLLLRTSTSVSYRRRQLRQRRCPLLCRWGVLRWQPPPCPSWDQEELPGLLVLL